MNAAHLHLMLNHVPVLGGVGVLVLLILSGFKDNFVLAKLTLQFMVFVGIVCLPVYFTGEPAEEIIEHLPGITEVFISQHERFALYSLICTVILAAIGLIGLLNWKKNSVKAMKCWRFASVVALVNAGLMITTANYGGQIRHTEIRKTDSTIPTTGKEQSLLRERDDD